MEIKRINKDTLRVLVSNDDLKQHGITFLDLLGDHDQIEKFFLGILSEADEYNEFSNDESALTFQVAPNEGGLEIFIKKNGPDSPEQLASLSNEMSSQPSDNVQQASNTLKDYSYAEADHDDHAIEQVIAFDNFEDVIKVAYLLDFHNGASNLYRYQRYYYLDLIFFLNIDNTSDDDVKNNLALAYEYGQPSEVTPSFLVEHGKKLMNTSAVELIRYYFK